MPGAARQQVTLFCLPKIQVTKQKGTLPRRPFGLPSVFLKIRAAAELALCAQTVLADGPRIFRKTEAVQKGILVLWAEPGFWVPSPLGRAVLFCFLGSLGSPPSSTAGPGDFGEQRREPRRGGG